jgi:hypothetical protein
MDRLRGMEEDAPTRDAEYQRGLREAVSSGVDYGIALLEQGVEQAPQVPFALVVQSRLAARQGIPLEMVIKRYLAAKTQLAHSLLEAAAASGVRNPATFQWALAAYETAFDRLLSTITEEYRQEEERCQRSSGDRQLDGIRRLLAGERVDPSFLDYDLNSHHLGMVVGSAEGRKIIRQLAAEVDSRPLIVRPTEAETWVWLGSKEALNPVVVGRLAADASPHLAPVAIGEPTQGLGGWRLTRRQAQAAFSIAQKSAGGFARYADVALVASAAKDPLITASFFELYLLPIKRERKEGEVLCETLRAYFATRRNASSAGAALKVSRQTVTNRLRTYEERIGRFLTDCATEVEVALLLEEIGAMD